MLTMARSHLEKTLTQDVGAMLSIAVVHTGVRHLCSGSLCPPHGFPLGVQRRNLLSRISLCNVIHALVE